MAAEIGNTNYYEILGITKESTEKEIVKAYRKKALICHPDKNPDNPKAAELFHELSEALKILTDPKAKAAYDSVLKAKELQRLRTQALDSKRKKFKQDLEERENAAREDTEKDVLASRNLEEEVKRLREEGSRLLKEQQELIKRQLEEERQRKQQHITPKLKVKWKSAKGDHQNGGYNEDILYKIFSKYGPVTTILVSPKKNGLAIVEYGNTSHAQIAVEFENGLEENPFKVTWLEGISKPKNDSFNRSTPDAKLVEEKIKPEKPVSSSETTTEPADFENIVLMKLKKAQESKRTTQTTEEI